MKKNVKIILIVLGSLLVLYFGIKAFFIYAYNTSKIKDEELESIRVIKISLKGNYAAGIYHNYLKEDEEYYIYEDIKFKNIFKDYEEIITKNDKYPSVSFKDSNGVRFGISKSDENLVDYIKEESKSMGFYYDLTNIFKENKVYTDIDLFKYLSKNYNKDVNILTMIKKIREYMAINDSVKLALPSVTDFRIIIGDYNGYIMKLNNSISSVHIENNGRYYSLLFTGYEDSDIYDFIGSIVIGNLTETPEKVSEEVINKLNETKKIIFRNEDIIIRETIDEIDIKEFIDVIKEGKVIRGPIAGIGSSRYIDLIDSDGNIIDTITLWNTMASIFNRDYAYDIGLLDKYIEVFDER